jgi:hypothetical protein
MESHWYIRKARIEVIEQDNMGNPLGVALVPEDRFDSKKMVKKETTKGQALLKQLKSK